MKSQWRTLARADQIIEHLGSPRVENEGETSIIKLSCHISSALIDNMHFPRNTFKKQVSSISTNLKYDVSANVCFVCIMKCKLGLSVLS